MARRKPNEQEAAGADSFLDVITNIVGILIILVMVVGERAKTAPPPERPPSAPSRELAEAESEATRLEQDVRDLQVRMANVQNEIQVKAIERGRVQTLIAAIERDLENEKQKLDERSRARYIVDRDLALARDELAKVEAERDLVEKAAAPQTVKIESYPTPIGKTVDDNEAHLQLRAGRLAVLPYEMLMSRLRGVLRSSVSRMGNQNEMVETLGPIEGFRMRYVIRRQDVAQGSVYELAYVEFLPISSQLGEPVDEVLSEDSDFRMALARMSPDRYTITIWTYPDSFAEFAKLKKQLYEMGYAVAARPLPNGMPIGASPSGSKSSAQ